MTKLTLERREGAGRRKKLILRKRRTCLPRRSLPMCQLGSQGDALLEVGRRSLRNLRPMCPLASPGEDLQRARQAKQVLTMTNRASFNLRMREEFIQGMLSRWHTCCTKCLSLLSCNYK